MKLSELRYALREEFGAAYSGVLMRDHWLQRLHATGEEALARGVAAREVWLAVCEEFQIPESRRYGRGLPERGD